MKKQVVKKQRRLIRIVAILLALAALTASASAYETAPVQLTPDKGSGVQYTRLEPAAARAYAEANPGRWVQDRHNNVWASTVVEADLFQTSYIGIDGSKTVQSSDGAKVIAPGTSGGVDISLKNPGPYNLHYLLFLSVWTEPEDLPIPFEARLQSRDGTWIAGDEDTWAELDALGAVSTASALLASQRSADYTFEWQWPFEREDGDGLAANDAADTALGNAAVDEDLFVKVLLQTTAWYTVSPGGGSGGTKYPVRVADTTGGTVRPSVTRADAGSVVSFVVTPDDGWQIGSVSVIDDAGNEITIWDEGGGVYTFVMPPRGVTIHAVFIPVSPLLPGLLNTDDHIRYLRGYPEGDIRPNGNITRAEVATIFYRLLLWPDVKITQSFPDVKDGAWYAKAVRSLASLGMITGYEDGTFRPDLPISRAEFTAIATRFAKAADGTVRFTDVDAGHWARDNIATAAAYGWVEGYGDGTFRPSNAITRAETAKIVNHMLGRAADGAWVAAHRDEINQFTDLQDPSKWYDLDMVEASNTHDYSRSGDVEIWLAQRKDYIE